MKPIHFFSTLLFLILISVSGTFAQTSDISGSKDHPLISRYPGSSIMHYEVRDFDEYNLPLGKVEKDKLKSVQNLEGKVTQITYAAPQDRSILEIFRNYESALKNAGFEILLNEKSGNLGDKWISKYLDATSRPQRDGTNATLYNRFDGSEFHFLAAKLSRPEGDVYTALCIGFGWWQKFPVVQLDVIEVKPMEKGLVTITADELKNDLTKTGRKAIYGIYFDTGKSQVKPESAETIKVIADYLKSNKSKKFYIVGHTDNVGDFSSNMKLAQDRAEAVLNFLVDKHQVGKDQLKAYGVSSLSPVATNSTDEGKKLNRRVELVEQ